MSWLREEVLRHADIVEVVSEYLPLKKRGSNYWALSPFKPEKTPSFAVSPSKQIFKCFASGKGGDVVRFVMEMEGLSYAEALRKLADKYGIPYDFSEEKRSYTKEKERYVALYAEVVRFYREQLPGSPAEAYLQKRGLKAETQAAFQLGYAPAGGEALVRYLLRLGYEERSLVEWGLALRQESTGRLYDRFRGRVIFPISDELGTVVALAGRIVEEASHEPKYHNSPETPFYRKSEILYGLAQARPHLRKGEAALIVEGYMDVLSLHQAGFPQAVATCGTALTESHLKNLRRYTRELILLYDSDSAGQSATERAIEAGLAAGFFVRVAQVPSGKDPDEFLQQAGPEALRTTLRDSLSWPLFWAKRHAEPQAQSRYQLLQKLGQGLQLLSDPALKRAYAEEIAAQLGIPPEFWQSFATVEQQAQRRESGGSVRITAEREPLRIALMYPEAEYGGLPLWRVLQEELRAMTFADPMAEALRAAFCEWPHSHPPTLADLSENLPPETQDWAAGLLLEKYSLSPHWRTWDDSPLEESPLQLAETNLTLLHLDHLQHLLEENLRLLESLPEGDITYQEHLALHQALVRQRAEFAHKQGLILPYRKAPPS